MFANRTIRSCAAAIAPVLLAVSSAAADPVEVRLEADTTTLAPGESTTVRLVADLDLAGQSSGIFGLGLFGFGGNVPITGPGEIDHSASNPSTFASLTTGVLADASGASGTLVTAAAGRSLDGALNLPTADLLTFTLTADPDADSGMFTLDFEGTVVLALGSSLASYSSMPGPNQNVLSVTPVEITISAGCSPADINADGNLNNSDINAFINAFISQAPAADFNGDGVYNNTDINLFIGLFLQGC